MTKCGHYDLRFPCLRCRFFASIIRDIARSGTFFALAWTSRLRLFFFIRTDTAANLPSQDESRILPILSKHLEGERIYARLV